MSTSNVDSAILEALGLDAENTKISSHGGSGFASTFKLSSTGKDGKPVCYFVKTGTGKEADVMFTGEHASLNAIHASVPTLCPQSHAHGVFSQDSNKFFLVTDFIDLHSKSHPGGSGESLAHKLGRLHTTPAPIPEGHEGKPQYGFPVTTCCGSTPQDNTFSESWPEFYAERRLKSILRAGVKSNGQDNELSSAVETTADIVVPRLLGAVFENPANEDKIQPVVCHGDLWSGNHGRGRIAGEGGTEEVVFDASAVYGHSEYELGIMSMFGGFGVAFWEEYERWVPRAEPREEWEDRKNLYELYHHLNHWAMFGGGYRTGALSIMKKLISKYGK